VSSPAKTYALKFISGKYQGGEFPLKMERQILIGRSNDLDMVLVEDMVSRKHAKISSRGGKINIEDLGSTNGTFVNGEKIKQARLKEGDRILIGTSILKLVQQADHGAELDDRLIKQRLEEAAEAHAKSEKSTSMNGKIEEVPIPDLLQLFSTSKKTGVLVVKNVEEGRVYFRQGRVYYAVIDDNHALGPHKSFNRMVTWESGDFELRPSEPQGFMVELEDSTEALLFQAMRLFDELKLLQNELPPLNSVLMLAMPMNAPLRALSSEELDALQLVHNYGSLKGVLDHSDKDDVTSARLVVSLIQKEYVQVG
jgi:pSer/pThr/pTyr-binding forkhead associated (FHA) protein